MANGGLHVPKRTWRGCRSPRESVIGCVSNDGDTTNLTLTEWSREEGRSGCFFLLWLLQPALFGPFYL